MQYRELRGGIPIGVPVPYVVAASGAAAGSGFTVPFNALIVAAAFVPAAAITGTATNFFTLSFFNRGPAGAGTVQWATAVAYSSGVNATKGNPVALTLSSTATDLQLAAGDNLLVELTTTGTGLTCPGGMVMLTTRWR